MLEDSASPRVLGVTPRPELWQHWGTERIGLQGGLTTVESLEDAVKALRDRTFLVVAVDESLCGEDDAAQCHELRAATDAALLVLSHGASMGQRLAWYEAGADDVIKVPTDPRDIFVRGRAVLQRSRRTRPRDELHGPCDLVLRPRSREVAVSATPVRLAAREFDLLELLLRRSGEVLTADALSGAVWGHETFGTRNYVEALVSRLRRKLASAGASGVVETVRGVGYVVR